jgi:hypothetical protein
MKENNTNINHIYISYNFFLKKNMKIIFLQSRYERFRQCWVGNPAHHNIFLHKNLHEDQKNCFVMDGRDEKGD